MPTGYTDKLYKGEDQSFEDFVARCARAFGATIMQRDESLDTGLRLRRPSTKYHNERIEAAIVSKAEAMRWTDEEADNVAAKDYQERYDKWQEACRKADARRKRYMDMFRKVKAWTPPTDDHKRLKSFMIDQLQESIKYDCSVYEAPKSMTGKEYRKHVIDRAERDLDYHFEQIEKEYERAGESNRWIEALADDLGLEIE